MGQCGRKGWTTGFHQRSNCPSLWFSNSHARDSSCSFARAAFVQAALFFCNEALKKCKTSRRVGQSMISFQSLLTRDRKKSAPILLFISSHYTKNLVSLMWYWSATSYFYFPLGEAPVILQIPCTAVKWPRIILQVKKKLFYPLPQDPVLHCSSEDSGKDFAGTSWEGNQGSILQYQS